MSNHFDCKCTILDHQEEDIIGLCFNKECTKPKKICFICFAKFHQGHQNDCLRFNQISLMIESCIQILDQMETTEMNNKQIVMQLFSNNLKFIKTEKDQLTELKINLKNQQQFKILDKQALLEKWRNVSLNKVVKNNISYQIEEIKKFSKSIDQLYKQYSNEDKIQIQLIHQSQSPTLLQSQQQQTIKNTGQGIKTEDIAQQYLNSAIDLFKDNQYEEVLNVINKALKLNSNLEQAYYIKGLSLVRLCQFEEGLDCFNDCIRLDLKIESVYQNKGFCLSNLKHFDEAIQSFNKALELKKDPNYYLNIAEALYLQQKYAQALDTINIALDLEGKAQFWRLKGAILHKLGNSNEELICYKNALKLDPNQSNIYHNIGVALYSLNKYEESLGYFDGALNLEPNSNDSLNQKGMSLQALNRHQEAIVCFDSAIQIQENGQYLLNKAQSLFSLKRQKEAIDILEYIRNKYGE